MRIIMKLSHDIKTELEAAEHYTEMAIECKVNYPKIAEMYMTLAKGELEDAMTLHKYAVYEIEESRKTATPPEYMLMIWNEEHKMLTERAAKVKYKLEMLAK